ncbi:MAG: hypothetical protein JWN02_1797, partial [Acidobacteria bacterium]|nr:hypothetical protein [Acidobacteriota bacterium]
MTFALVRLLFDRVLTEGTASPANSLVGSETDVKKSFTRPSATVGKRRSASTPEASQTVAGRSP